MRDSRLLGNNINRCNTNWEASEASVPVMAYFDVYGTINSEKMKMTLLYEFSRLIGNFLSSDEISNSTGLNELDRSYLRQFRLIAFNEMV